MDVRGNSKGFTLIELLVVIAIIGLLASIILASLNTAQQKGRDARRIADVREIQNALQLYDQTCKSYPIALTTSTNNGTCPSGTTLGTFIPTVPTDPRSGNGYLYAAFGSAGSQVCNSYHLGADLEVGQTVGYNISAGATGTGNVCNKGGSPTGAYAGASGNGISTISATGGDFSPEGSVGSWVYDVNGT